MPHAASPQRAGFDARCRRLGIHPDVEVRLVIVLIARLQSDADSASGRNSDECSDVEVMRPTPDLARWHGRSSERANHRRAVAEPPGKLLKTRWLTGVERVSDGDVVPRYLVVARESVTRSLRAQEFYLRPNPVFRFGDSAAMQMVFSERTVVSGGYQQAELDGLHADA